MHVEVPYPFEIRIGWPDGGPSVPPIRGYGMVGVEIPEVEPAAAPVAIRQVDDAPGVQIRAFGAVPYRRSRHLDLLLALARDHAPHGTVARYWFETAAYELGYDDLLDGHSGAGDHHRILPSETVERSGRGCRLVSDDGQEFRRRTAMKFKDAIAIDGEIWVPRPHFVLVVAPPTGEGPAPTSTIREGNLDPAGLAGDLARDLVFRLDERDAAIARAKSLGRRYHFRPRFEQVGDFGPDLATPAVRAAGYELAMAAAGVDAVSSHPTVAAAISSLKTVASDPAANAAAILPHLVSLLASLDVAPEVHAASREGKLADAAAGARATADSARRRIRQGTTPDRDLRLPDIEDEVALAAFRS